MKKGKLNIRVNNREELLSIKSGAMAYDDLLQKADDLIASIEMAEKTTILPDLPNYEKRIATLIKIREALYT